MLFRPHPGSSAGEGESFEAQALAFIDRLYAAAVRLTANEADAEDLVQDTYLKAFRSADKFRPGTNLKAWLFTILHNTFLNDRRRAGRNPVEAAGDLVEQAPAPAAAGQTPEQILMRASLDADLQAALDSLPPAFRQAVWLRDVEEFTYAEIARMLGIPLGTVMSRISRGRRLLYERLTAGSQPTAVGREP